MGTGKSAMGLRLLGVCLIVAMVMAADASPQEGGTFSLDVEQLEVSPGLGDVLLDEGEGKKKKPPAKGQTPKKAKGEKGPVPGPTAKAAAKLQHAKARTTKAQQNVKAAKQDLIAEQKRAQAATRGLKSKVASATDALKRATGAKKRGSKDVSRLKRKAAAAKRSAKKAKGKLARTKRGLAKAKGKEKVLGKVLDAARKAVAKHQTMVNKLRQDVASVTAKANNDETAFLRAKAVHASSLHAWKAGTNEIKMLKAKLKGKVKNLAKLASAKKVSAKKLKDITQVMSKGKARRKALDTRLRKGKRTLAALIKKKDKQSAANSKEVKRFRQLQDAASNAKQQVSIRFRKLTARAAAFVRSKGKLKTAKQFAVMAAKRKARLVNKLRKARKAAKAGTKTDKKVLSKAKRKLRKDLRKVKRARKAAKMRPAHKGRKAASVKKKKKQRKK